MGRNVQLLAKINVENFETVRDTRNISMNHDYETGVALSHFVNKTCVKRWLVKKSRWHHIRLAIKLHYLGNHAKSYYGMLSGSHVSSFRIRHDKVRVAPPQANFYFIWLVYLWYFCVFLRCRFIHVFFFCMHFISFSSLNNYHEWLIAYTMLVLLYTFVLW